MERVYRARLFDVVADRLQAYIVENRLQPGDKLPSQQELCDRLGVSHSSLREALRLLQTAGILETRSGTGIFVTDFSLAPLVYQASRYLLDHPSRFGEVKELVEVRDGLEVLAVSLAASRMDENSIREMREVLERAEAKLQAGIPPVEESASFHDSMYRGTGNGVLTRLASAVTHLLFELQREWLQGDPSGERLRRDYTEHLAIYKALRDGRDEDARELMSRHLTHAREFLELWEARWE